MLMPTIRVLALTVVFGALILPVSADDKPIEKPVEKVELKVGDAAPVVDLKDSAGQGWKSTDHYGKNWVVIYFYPGDFTPGCTAQASAFRDAMNKLTDQGVEVVGISGDSVSTHEMFKKAQNLNFTLLSDEEGAIARKFGVPVGKGATVKAKDADGKPIEFKRAVTTRRWTFVVGRDGMIAYKNTNVAPAQDAKAISEFIAKAKKN